MNRILTWFLLFLGYISSKLAQKNRICLGKFIGIVLKKLSSKREQITFDNLIKAFPGKNADEIKKIVKGAYQNLGIVLIEVITLKYLSEDELREYVCFENSELIPEIYNRGKGLIFLSGHFGNWEYLAYTAGLFFNIPILIVVKEQQNRFMDKILNRYRTMSNNKVVSMANAARDLIHTLMNGKAIAMLADQSARNGQEIYVDFFGRPAATFDSPAVLALRYNVPIIYGFAIRQENGSYRVKLEELKVGFFFSTSVLVY